MTIEGTIALGVAFGCAVVIGALIADAYLTRKK